MLKSFALCLFLLAGTTSLLTAQKAFPTPELTNVALEPVALADHVGKGQPTVIAVWATWCQPCHTELDHMKSYLDKWENEYGAKVLAISVDRAYQVRKIKPLVKRKGWQYDILVDSDGLLQQQLGFRSIPQMYILNGDGKIVKEFSGYRSGRETQVDQLLSKMVSR